MIIVAQVVGTDLADIVVDENQFVTQTGATDVLFAVFEYDGADWQYNSTVVDMGDYGITFTGTPIATDSICVAYNPQTLYTFSAGKGINQVKLNYNFGQLQQQSNTNETNIDTIANTALLKDGSNLTQTIIDEFQQQTPNILSTSGTIALTDNSANFLTLTGTGTISLPNVPVDQYSHTINLVVAGSAYSLDLGATKHLYNPLAIDTTQTYNVLYIYNKIDNSWYYSITQ